MTLISPDEPALDNTLVAGGRTGPATLPGSAKGVDKDKVALEVLPCEGRRTRVVETGAGGSRLCSVNPKSSLLEPRGGVIGRGPFLLLVGVTTVFSNA